MTGNGPDVIIHVPRTILWTLAITFVLQFIAWVALQAGDRRDLQHLDARITEHQTVPAHSNIDVRVTRIETILESEGR